MSPVVLTGDVTAPILHAVTHPGCQRGIDEALQLPKGPGEAERLALNRARLAGSGEYTNRLTSCRMFFDQYTVEAAQQLRVSRAAAIVREHARAAHCMISA
jgi:hypothetical protein